MDGALGRLKDRALTSRRQRTNLCGKPCQEPRVAGSSATRHRALTNCHSTSPKVLHSKRSMVKEQGGNTRVVMPSSIPCCHWLCLGMILSELAAVFTASNVADNSIAWATDLAGTNPAR